jgi:hypothetical protein
MWFQRSVAQASVTLVVVEVEPWVPPADVGAEVGRKPTVVADTGAATADKAGRCGHDGTPSGIWEEHCRTKLTRPSSSLLPCGRGSHRPQ